MESRFTGTASITIATTTDKVWAALTTPALVKQIMFGADVVSDWKKGGPLVYKGVWEGKPYEDKGTILAIEPERLLEATYFSPLSGKEDKPDNYNTITYRLAPEAKGTKLTVSQSNNPTAEGAAQAEKNLGTVLASIKALLEK